MKTIIFLIASLLGSLTLTSQNTSLTQTIRGTVIDEQSGTAISGATVTLTKGTTAITDNNGQFTLMKVSIGRQTIVVTNIGYENSVVANIEVTSTKEVVLEIKLKEKVRKEETVTVKAQRSKTRAINDAALVSARQLSTDEAFRYSGTRSDPSRMAQNFAGVSGGNDARNDIIIRGNSPTGVLWRMDGIDIPNPNHFSTLGSTGGPVSILNINTLKNSDFLTSAFPAQYGNAVAGVFDLRMKNGNANKYEFLGQMGFNGLELGAEGPISKSNKSSFLVNYRYSMLAGLQKLGLKFGTGSATPYYQDINFKINLPTKKAGTFSMFGLGGESHIEFLAKDASEDNLYPSSDGSQRDRNFKSLTGVIGISHQYFYNSTTSSKTTIGMSGTSADYNEYIVSNNKPNKLAFLNKNKQSKTTIGHSFNKKFNAKNQLTAGIMADISNLNLRHDIIRNGDSTLSNLTEEDVNVLLSRGYLNYYYRFTDKVSTNIGLYAQHFNINNSFSVEPRWNLKYQIQKNQSLALGAGLHSQTQPLEIYYYKNTVGVLTNKELGFTKNLHTVLGYDISFKNNLRLKAELYHQQVFNAPVEKNPSSFSLLNFGSEFGFPSKSNLVNNGIGYNQGIELTVEKFLNKGFYYLLTSSLFESKYKGSDGIWRNTAFKSNYVINGLIGKEILINTTNSIGIDSKITYTGGQRYTPFDIPASSTNRYVTYKENEAFSLQNNSYFRWDVKFSYIRNGERTTQKWYIDLQNLTGQKNIYIRTLNPQTGKIQQINQIGFFPNINYQITF